MAMPLPNMTGGDETKLFKVTPTTTVNFGSYYGGAATTQGQPATVAAVSPVPVLVIVGLGVLIWAVTRKGRK